MEPAHGAGVRLLAFDGGGVRGLSSLRILQRLMEHIDPNNPPKPCDCFDMICGTSTGGLIAIMLGRLRMSVGDCIVEYEKLSASVFTKLRHRLGWSGKLQGRFDHEALETGIKDLLRRLGLPEDELMREDEGTTRCKTFVCSINQQTSNVVLFPSYYSTTWGSAMLDRVRIWEAARATSAATTFFEPITIAGQTFADGATGANSPIFELWAEASSVFCRGPGSPRLEDQISCLVSIGTGIPSLKAFGPEIKDVAKALKSIALSAEEKWEQFQRQVPSLAQDGRLAFRFNVAQGLQSIGLEDADRLGDIDAYTDRYCRSAHASQQLEACAKALKDNDPDWLDLAVMAIQSHSLIPGFEEPYVPKLAMTIEPDLESYTHTAAFQDWICRDEGLLLCTTTLSTNDLAITLADKLSSQLESPSSFIRLYVDCFWVDPSRQSHGAGDRLAEILREERGQFVSWKLDINQVLTSLYRQLISQFHPSDVRNILQSFISAHPEAEMASFRKVFAETGVPPPDYLSRILRELYSWPSQRRILVAIDRICLLQPGARQALMNFSFTSKVKVLLCGASPTCDSVVRDGSFLYLSVTPETESQDCIESLVFSEIDVRKSQVSPAAVGTASWIWTHPVYHSFASQVSGILWISGKPGSGKSVLARAVRDRLSAESQQLSAGTLLGDWFYHRRRGGDFVTHDSLVRSILYHFLKQDKSLFGTFFKPIFRRMDPSSPSWETRDLVEIFEKTCQSSRDVFCVIDAVDEAESTEVVELLSRAVANEKSRAKFIMLSRPNAEIERQATAYSRIVVEHENANDVHQIVNIGLEYLQQMIHSLDFGNRGPAQPSKRSRQLMNRAGARQARWRSLAHAAERESKVLESIRQGFISKAQGSILWVKIVLDRLTQEAQENHCSTLEELEQVMVEVPEELAEYYKQITEDLTANKSPKTIQKIRQCLMWISAAGELGDVTLDSLWEALALLADNFDSDSFDAIWDKQVPISTYDELWRKIYTTCGPFIEIFNSGLSAEESRGYHYGPSSIVQLMHQSVRDFLCDPSAVGALHFGIEEAKSMVARHLERYLTLFVEDNARIDLEGPQASEDVVDRLNEQRLLRLALQEGAARDWPVYSKIQAWLAERMSLSLQDPFDERERLLKRLMRPTSCFHRNGMALDEPKEGPVSIGRLFYRACVDGLPTAVANLLAFGWPDEALSARLSLAAIIFAVRCCPGANVRIGPLQVDSTTTENPDLVTYDTPHAASDARAVSLSNPLSIHSNQQTLSHPVSPLLSESPRALSPLSGAFEEFLAGADRRSPLHIPNNEAKAKPEPPETIHGTASHWYYCSWTVSVFIAGREEQSRRLMLRKWCPYLDHICGSKGRALEHAKHADGESVTILNEDVESAIRIALDSDMLGSPYAARWDAGRMQR